MVDGRVRKVREGGEGLILNDPDSFYVRERTRSVLKVKVNCWKIDFQPQSETEVRLLEILPKGLYCQQ